jgi:hypothetical protein
MAEEGVVENDIDEDAIDEQWSSADWHASRRGCCSYAVPVCALIKRSQHAFGSQADTR